MQAEYLGRLPSWLRDVVEETEGESALLGKSHWPRSARAAVPESFQVSLRLWAPTMNGPATSSQLPLRHEPHK